MWFVLFPLIALRKEQKRQEEASSKRLDQWRWVLVTAVLLLAVLGLYYYYTFYQPTSHPPSSSSSSSSKGGVPSRKNSADRQTGGKKSKVRQEKRRSTEKPEGTTPRKGRQREKKSSSPSSSAGKRPVQKNLEEIRLADIPVLRRPLTPSDQDRPYILEILAADDLLQAGNYNGALEKFNEVLGRFRQSPRASFGKAQVLEHMAEKKASNKLLDTAIEYYHDVAFESFIANDDLKLNALIRLAHHAQHRGKMTLAIKALKKACKMEPTNIKYAINLGVALLTDKQTDEALEQFHKVLNRWPESSTAHAHLGYLLYLGKKYKEALPHLLTGVRGKGGMEDDPKYHLYTGDALMRLNRSREVGKY